jgi:hypothetical protein
MAKFSLVFAIVFTLLTAVIGFMTKSRVDGLQGTLGKTRTELGSTKSALDKKTADLKKSTEDLTAANKTIDGQKETIGSLTAERDDAKKKSDDATGQLADRDKQISDLKAQIEVASRNTGTGNPGELAEKVAAMQNQLKSNETALLEKQQVIDDLTNKVKTNQGQLDTANSEVKRYKYNIAQHGFTGRVEAVNPGWNFVVINVGDRQGATVNSQLVVIRNGQNIGKVRITAVEPTTSIADVIPGTMARGQRVQPGDEVVFIGTRASTAQPSPSLPSSSDSGTAPSATAQRQG